MSATTTERTVLGTRINGRWAFVVNSRDLLAVFRNVSTTMDTECACGENGMTLRRFRVLDDPPLWQMVCDGCHRRYEVVEMPARMCNAPKEG